MRKLVISTCHGGFGLSKAAMAYVGYTPSSEYDDYNDCPRDNPRLIEFIERYGSEDASDDCSELRIVEIPDDVEWQVEQYDGYEWIAEKHRVWYGK